jgi:hypothetical protein
MEFFMTCTTSANNKHLSSVSPLGTCSTGTQGPLESVSVRQFPLPTFDDYFPSEPPARTELNEQAKSLLGLLPVRNLRQQVKGSKGYIDPLLLRSRNLEEYEMLKKYASLRMRCKSDPDFRRDYLNEHKKEPSSHSHFKVSRFRSGEMVGAFYTTGMTSKATLTSRSGALVTRHFTRSALQQIRRSVQCSQTFLRYFCTLTFSPGHLQPWHVNEDGTVRHDFAKWKLHKFLDACYRQQRRLNRELSYVWVAELQKNGNIHFHFLFDQFFNIAWLTKIWDQAVNSVDITRVNNPLHAARYMRKYITKDEESEIQGNRYFISQKLRKDMKPVIDDLVKAKPVANDPNRDILRMVRHYLTDSKEAIENSGGFVIDFGFCIPPPSPPSSWKCKKTGQIIHSNGVSPFLAKFLFTSLYELTEPLPF